MKTKNIYKMGIAFSFLIAIFPTFFYISATIMSKFLDCGFIKDLSVDKCAGGEMLANLYIWSWFIVITLPTGIILAFIFYLLYLSVRRR